MFVHAYAGDMGVTAEPRSKAKAEPIPKKRADPLEPPKPTPEAKVAVKAVPDQAKAPSTAKKPTAAKAKVQPEAPKAAAAAPIKRSKSDHLLPTPKAVGIEMKKSETSESLDTQDANLAAAVDASLKRKVTQQHLPSPGPSPKLASPPPSSLIASPTNSGSPTILGSADRTSSNTGSADKSVSDTPPNADDVVDDPDDPQMDEEAAKVQRLKRENHNRYMRFSRSLKSVLAA